MTNSLILFGIYLASLVSLAIYWFYVISLVTLSWRMVTRRCRPPAPEPDQDAT